MSRIGCVSLLFFDVISMHMYNQILYDVIQISIRTKRSREEYKAAYVRVSGHSMAGALKRRVLSRVKRA